MKNWVSWKGRYGEGVMGVPMGRDWAVGLGLFDVFYDE
jgi:hypothetical protein